MEPTNSAEYRAEDGTVDFLYRAIEDCQNTIRFTDTKAGVVVAAISVIMGYLLNETAPILNHVRHEYIGWWTSVAGAIALVAIVSVVVSLLFGLGAIRPVTDAYKQINADGVSSSVPFAVKFRKGVGVFRGMRARGTKPSAKELLIQISATSAAEEILKALVLELLKLSYIRDRKVRRSTHAIRWMGVAILSITCLSVVLQVLGW